MINNQSVQDCTAGTGFGEHQPIAGPWEQNAWERDEGLGLASQGIMKGTSANEIGEYKKLGQKLVAEKLEAREENL